MAENEPRQKAVAIVYDEATSAAPQVLASGQGLVAEKIIATAQKAGIHIHEDANLVEVLSKVPLGSDIPVELYQTVAEVLAFVYRIDQRYKEKLRR